MIALAIFLAYFGHFGYLGISFVSFGHPLEQDNVSSTYVSHLQRFGQHAKWIIVDLPSSKCFLTILHQTMTPWSSEDAIRLCQQYFSFILLPEREKGIFSYKDQPSCKAAFSAKDMSYGHCLEIYLAHNSTFLFGSSPISRGRRRLETRQPPCSAILDGNTSHHCITSSCSSAWPGAPPWWGTSSYGGTWV